jgi:hypothetical protein
LFSSTLCHGSDYIRTIDATTKCTVTGIQVGEEKRVSGQVGFSNCWHTFISSNDGVGLLVTHEKIQNLPSPYRDHYYRMCFRRDGTKQIRKHFFGPRCLRTSLHSKIEDQREEQTKS